MNREEAIRAVQDVKGGFGLVDSLAALGLLKLDEPAPPTRETRLAGSTIGAGGALGSLLDQPHSLKLELTRELPSLHDPPRVPS
jgi:hypothetical protein